MVKIQNTIIRIKSYGILVSEFAAGGKIRNKSKTVEFLKKYGKIFGIIL